MSGEGENIENKETSTQEDVINTGITFTPEPSNSQEALIENVNNEPNVDINLSTDDDLEQWVDTPFEELASFDNNTLEDDGFEDDETILVEANDENLFRLLKDKKGLDVENFDDLLAPRDQKKYAPEMEKFNEFIEKTGNKNYNEFLETQKDWTTEKEEVVLKNYIKLSNPSLTDKEVNHLYNKNYNIDGLDEEDDEDTILEKGINTKTDLQKALVFFDKRKEDWNVVGGSDEHIPLEYREAKKVLDSQKKQEEDYEADINVKRNNFVSKTESLFSNNFEGFKVQLGDEKTGFEDFTIKPENLNEIKEFQIDSNNFMNKFLDKTTGEITDIKGYHEAIYMANNYKSEMNKAYERGRAKELEIQDKLSKNIQPDNILEAKTIGLPGIKFTLEK